MDLIGATGRKAGLTLRYSRVAMSPQLKRQMEEMLGYGLAIEGQAAVDV
ncbi:MAG: hypothetical protein IH870_11065 [Chloroflexi bacterium]|nr:hypothetical protein [Chloroflexota bacterium]